MASPARSEFLPNLGLGLGLLPAAFGASMLLNPQGALDTFGFTQARAAHGEVLHGFIRVHAARNIVVSLLLTGLRYRGDRRLLGIGLMACCLMAGVDGLVSRQLTGHGEWKHWGFLPILIGVGAPLAWQG